MKKIKNYTSQVNAGRTVSMIESELVGIGANKIEKTYHNGAVNGIIFSIDLPDGISLCYKLPAKIEEARGILREIPEYRRKPKVWIEAQAERTAWKIIYEWVQIQVAMIQLHQADAMQVFLPYAYNRIRKQTFYDQMVESKFKLLTE